MPKPIQKWTHNTERMRLKERNLLEIMIRTKQDEHQRVGAKTGLQFCMPLAFIWVGGDLYLKRFDGMNKIYMF